MAIPTIEQVEESGANMDTITEFVKSGDETLVDQYGDTRRTLTGANNDVDDAVRNAGGIPLGDGQYSLPDKTYTVYNQYLVQNGISYKPLVVPHTTDVSTYPSASDDPNLQPWMNLSELETIEISLNVAPGSVIYDSNTVSAIPEYIRNSVNSTTYSVPVDAQGSTITSVTDDLLVSSSGTYRLEGITPVDYTLINSDFTLIDSEISQIAKVLNVVITGDSLAINGYGYPVGWGVNGGLYATDNPFGMSSWPHLLRDTWLTSGYFQPIKTSKYYGDADTFLSSAIGLQHVAINQKGLVFNFAPGETLTIENEFTGASALLISSQPSGNSVTFDLNGTPQTTLSATGDYQGYEFQLIPFTGDSALIENVLSPTAGDVNIIIYGIVPASTVVPKLTGKGAYTSTQILTEYNDLVGQYSPDIVFYIIGANDAGLGDPDVSGYNSSVQQFIDNARAAKPACVIVLISMPDTPTYTQDQIQQYVKAGYNLAVENNCSHIDMYEATRNVTSDYWRFDNIHCNTKGDTLWFNIFKSFLFPNASVNVDKFTPVREAILGITTESMLRDDESHSFTVQLTATTPTITGIKSELVPSVYASYLNFGGQDVCQVTAPKGFKVASVESLIVAEAQTTTIRSFQDIAADGRSRAFRVTNIADNVTINPDNTQLYAKVTIVRDNSLI